MDKIMFQSVMIITAVMSVFLLNSINNSLYRLIDLVK